MVLKWMEQNDIIFGMNNNSNNNITHLNETREREDSLGTAFNTS